MVGAGRSRSGLSGAVEVSRGQPAQELVRITSRWVALVIAT